jgi:mRNA interferase HigB
VRIIARRTLVEFWKLHPDSEQGLKSWYHEALRARWEMPQDIKAQYRTASVLKGSRVVFNIAGNKYRLLCKTEYRIGFVYIAFVGTHREYDKIDAETYHGKPIQGHQERE